MRGLSDERLFQLASCLAKQKGLRITSVTKRKLDILLDAAEHALRDMDSKWEASHEQKAIHGDS